MKKLQETHFHIIGSGAVGSFTTVTLAKMGAENITIYDFDKVENHNRSNQYFGINDLGMYKVDAVARKILVEEEIIVTPISKKYIRQTFPKDVVNVIISAVDSMPARISIWKGIKKQWNKVELYIDSRMAGKFYELYSVRYPSDFKFYEDSLVDPKDALQEKCTERAILYTILPIAGRILRNVANYINGERVEQYITENIQNLEILNKK